MTTDRELLNEDLVKLYDVTVEGDARVHRQVNKVTNQVYQLQTDLMEAELALGEAQRRIAYLEAKMVQQEELAYEEIATRDVRITELYQRLGE